MALFMSEVNGKKNGLRIARPVRVLLSKEDHGPEAAVAGQLLQSSSLGNMLNFLGNLRRSPAPGSDLRNVY
jgi:hypothetical protein